MRGTAVAVVSLALVVSACGETEGGVVGAPPAAPTTTRPPVAIGPGPTTIGPTTTTTTAVPPPSLAPLRSLSVEVVARDLDNPVFVTSPAGDSRLFVVEQDGRIRIIAADGLVEEPFLDIEPLVGSRGLEQGLLGLAFHPSYTANGRFFVYYTDTGGDSQVVEYGVGEDPDRADPSSARLLLTQSQPAGNHNGGMVAFGPDGYLYVGLGDGGGANDQFGHGQRTDTLLGAILRLDIDAAEPYAIPPDNPFVNGGGAPEVWAFGLRNPWRFSIDGPDLYIGDVGQGSLEEIDVIGVSTAGANLGWPIFEGTACLEGDRCSDGAFVGPVAEFGHGEGCSVIGGYVYRGSAVPELDGLYFYSDWCAGFLRSFRYDAGTATDHRDWTEEVGRLGDVLTLGADAAGELYITNGDGFVFRLVPVR